MVSAGFTVGSVYLNRCVVDSEPLADPVDLLDGLGIRRRAVERERDLTVADVPNMEIMDILHSGNDGNFVVDLLPIDRCGGLIQQNRQRAFHHTDRGTEHQDGKAKRQQRVDNVPFGLPPNHETSNKYGKALGQISHDVQVRGM